MTITPSTDLYLLKLPIELNDENQLTFASASAQATYFQSLTKTGATDFTYQRRDNAIRYPAHIDSILQYNYVMYKNDNYSNKWFYARIMNMQYVNDGMTLIEIEEDSFQTWQFDLGYAQCFVEREHVMDDTFGEHTVPENLETGEFVRGLTGGECSYSNQFWLVFQVTELISNMDDAGTGTHRVYNGIYNGLYAVLVDNYTTADLLVAAYDDAGKSESIVSCFYIPKGAIPSYITNSGCVLHGSTVTIYFPQTSASAVTMDTITVNKPATIDAYTPKNNKLFTREFCYMLASNNSGSEATFNFEDFRDVSTGKSLTSATFIVRAALAQGGSVRMFPGNEYKAPKGTASYTTFNSVAKYGLTGGKLPICSWNSDYYTNWLTQNAVNIGVSAVDTGLGVIGSLATGNVVGAMSTLFGGISENMKASYAASIVPNQAKGNINCGDINFTEGLHLTVTTMTVRKEMAKMIDDYFSAYGYKVNSFKIPNTTGRTNWNFIKTHGAAFHGDMPQESCDHINKMFDDGITLWHNPATFRDYTQSNTIVTPTP